MANLPIPMDLSDITSIQLTDGQWYEVHTETLSVGPLVFMNPAGGDIKTNIMAMSADVVEMDMEAGKVGEVPFRLTCRLDAIVACRQ